MDIDEALGIATFLREHAQPVGDGSIADRQTQTVLALATEVHRLQAEVLELGIKYVREVQRVEHCETCVHQDNDLCRGAGR